MNRLSAAVTVLIAVGLYGLVGSIIVPTSWKHDFLNFYTGAEFARTGRLAELYEPEALGAFQKPIAPDNPYVVPFSRPHFYAVLLAPMSALPYRTAFTLWLMVQTGLLMACWAWIARRFRADALVLAALFFPAGAGICLGQDTSFLLALAIVSYALFEQGREVPAGAVAGLMLVKFHLVLLVPVVMLVQRRWRLFSGFAATGLALLLMEFVIAGPAGMADYVHFLTRRDLAGLNPGEDMMVNLNSLLLNFGIDTWAARLPLAAAAVALIAAGSIGASWWQGLAAAGLGAAFLLPHIYIYDLAWLLLPLQCAVSLSPVKPLRLAALPLLTPIPYLMNLGGAPWAATTAMCILAALCANAWAARTANTERIHPAAVGVVG